HGGPARRPGARARAAGLRWHEALAAADRRGRRGGARTTRRNDRGPRARASLLTALDRGVPRAAGGGAARPGGARLRRELARPRVVPRGSGGTRTGLRWTRRLHGALAARADPSRRRPIPRPAARALAARWRA